MTGLSKMNREQLVVEAERLNIDPSTLTVPELRARIVEAQDAAGDPDPFAQMEDEQADRPADPAAPPHIDADAVEVPIADDVASPAEHPPSEQLAPINDAAARDAFRAMALADEQQVVDEMQGRALDVMVYSFQPKGSNAPVTGLSWKGIREVVRTLNARGYTRLKIAKEPRPVFEDVLTEEGDPAWQVAVYAEDERNGGGSWGVAAQPKAMKLRNGSTKPDPFAKTKALSKAQRNALESLLPAQLVEALKAQYHGEGRVKMLPGTISDAPSDRPPPLTDDRAKDQIATCRSVFDEIKRLNRLLLPPGKFNVLIRGAEHDHGRLDDLIEHLESLRDQEAEIGLLTSVLADHYDTRQQFDDAMKAVDQAGGAGQAGRLARLQRFVEDEGIQNKVEAAEGAAGKEGD